MTATLPANEPIPIGRARREANAAPVITIDGVHKVYGPRGNQVLALDGDTGKEIWRYQMPPRVTTTARGVAY